MFSKCSCQNCKGHIEFDASSFQAGETRQVECPHCHLETQIFVPPSHGQSSNSPPVLAHAAKGTILDYTLQTNAGIISGDDGRRYTFQGAEWRESGQFPLKGMRVDFVSQAGTATAIYLIQDVSNSTKTRPKQFPKVIHKKGVLQFQNQENGFIEEVSNAPLLVLLLGCFYFAMKGVWTHAVAGALAALLTCGISWLVYPFFADQIMRTHYLSKGWVLCSDGKDVSPKS